MVVHTITEAFAGVDLLEADGDYYFYYRPNPALPPDYRLPFATLVTDDRHDAASQLHRAGIYRLNIGVRPATYRDLFGHQPSSAVDGNVIDTGHDYAALDRLMPHPIYAPMSWVSVLNPSPATLAQLQPLLTEAYSLAVQRYRPGSQEP
jgi:hypothetical protein